MARWKDDRLDLGALGIVTVGIDGYYNGWVWSLNGTYETTTIYLTAARARGAAEAWLRKALKQAGKRLEARR